MRGLLGVLSALTLWTLAAGLAVADEPKTLSITDDRGVRVEVPFKPQRLATISYIGTDIALALGIKPVATTYMEAGHEPAYLAGLTDDIKKIGQRATPNLELLSAAKPDLIVAIRRYTVGNADKFQQIAPYVAWNMELMSESYQEVADLAKILGEPERGQQLNDQFKQDVADFAGKAPKDAHPSFVVMYGGDNPFAFHTENTAASIVASIGGDNVVGVMPPGGRFGINISLEELLAKDPDVIFIIDYYPGRTEQNNPIWPQLSAVRNHRVYYVDDEWAETNGPIAREIVLREAAHDLYPNTFPEIDVRAEAAKFIPADLKK